jgi:serine/threonine protein kinase
VLFKEGHWKLADFGFTSEATSRRLVTTSKDGGKEIYRSPEILIGKGGFNNKADIWAFGCIVFELFTHGQKAFENDFC